MSRSRRLDIEGGNSARLRALYRAAVDEARSKEERIEAARRLQSLYPDYFSKMSTEQIMLGDAKAKYDELTDSDSEKCEGEGRGRFDKEECRANRRDRTIHAGVGEKRCRYGHSL